MVIAAIAPWFGLSARDLWNPDEADHACAARELLLEGRWAVPTIAGETFAEKPPLQVWAIILSAKLRGTDVDSFDARVPSAIGSVLLVLATFILGKRAGGPWHGALAVLLAATCAEGFLRARWCQVDALFAGFFAWGAVFALELVTRPRALPALLLGSSLGLAILSKGPIAPALLVAALGADFLLERTRGDHWDRRAIPFLILAFAVAGAIALPWYWALANADRSGLGRSLIHENLDRFLHSQDHNNPPWYYATGALWAALAPAAWLLPPALVFCWQTAAGSQRRRIHTRDDRVVRFSLAGFAGGLLLLSAASSKQGKYLLPLLPFVGVVVADFARHVVAYGRAWQRIWLTTVLSILALLLVIASLFCLAASWFGARADAALASLVASFGGPGEVIVPVAAVLWPLLFVGFGSLALLAAGSASRGSLRLTWLSGSFCCAMLLGAGPVFAALDKVKSPRPAVDFAMSRIDALANSARPPRYAIYFPDRQSGRDEASWTGFSPFVYYASPERRRPLVLHGVEALGQALAAPDSGPLVLVMRASHYAGLPAELRARLRVRFQKETGSRTLVVVDSGD